jgi:uncharacterized protein
MNRLKIPFMIVVGLLSFIGTANTFAASFDCTKASSLVENVICSDSELSTLDETLASSYRSALADANQANTIKLTQRDWLKKRNLCKDKACLNNLYVQRINDLANLNPLPKKVGDCIDSTIMGKSTRFEGAIAGESGGEVAVQFKNDLYLYIQSIANFPSTENTDKYMFSTKDFLQGDKVKVCLQELPTDCPKGDDRGKIYSVTNYKNNKSFVGVDAWHLCGGA